MGHVAANQVADYLIRAIHSRGSEVSNLQLQKLLYYAQGLFLAETGEPLFDAPLEAWKRGPVQPGVYNRFKGPEWRDVDDPPDSITDMPKDVQEHLDMIITAFGTIPPVELAEMTHRTDPWQLARGDLGPRDRSSARISHENMKAFFEKFEDEILATEVRDALKESEEGIDLDEALKESLR